MAVERTIDITPKQRKTILSLLEIYLPNTAAWVYGSRVKWSARPSSDLDMVVFSKPEQSAQVYELRDAFDESDLPFRVDLFVWDEVPEQFHKNIEAEHVVLKNVGLGMTRRSIFSIQKLASLCSKIGSGATPRGGSKVYSSSGEYSLIRSQNVLNDRFDKKGLVYIGQDQADKLSNVTVKKDDVLLNITGDSVARCCQADSRVLPARVNQHVAIIRAQPEYLHPRFLRYFLVSPSMQNHMLSLAGAGATRNALTKGMIESFDIPLPPLPEQKAIAHILGALDDKIDVNRRMNETLEAMAQALFKSWFVDFDPVIDNALAAGHDIPEALQAKAFARKTQAAQKHPPKPLSHDIRQHFPDAFAFSETMGWIPEGWEVKTLDALINLIGGGTPKTSISEYWNGNIPWFSVVDAPNISDVFVIDTEKHVTTLGVENSSTKILPVGTTIISARGTVGKCAMVARPMAMNQSCYGIRGKDGISDSFVYYAVLTKVAELQQRGHGSVFNTITGATFKGIQMPFGGVGLTLNLETFVKPYLDKILDNRIQSTSLTQLRDTLLPKLLSGEVRIPEAEKFVEQAL